MQTQKDYLNSRTVPQLRQRPDAPRNVRELEQAQDSVSDFISVVKDTFQVLDSEIPMVNQSRAPHNQFVAKQQERMRQDSKQEGSDALDDKPKVESRPQMNQQQPGGDRGQSHHGSKKTADAAPDYLSYWSQVSQHTVGSPMGPNEFAAFDQWLKDKGYYAGGATDPELYNWDIDSPDVEEHVWTRDCRFVREFDAERQVFSAKTASAPYGWYGWLDADGNYEQLEDDGTGGAHLAYVFDNYKEELEQKKLAKAPALAIYGILFDKGWVRVTGDANTLGLQMSRAVSPAAFSEAETLAKDAMKDQASVYFDIDDKTYTAFDKPALGKTLREVNKLLGKTASTTVPQVIRQSRQVETTDMVCPHCKQAIHEKGLFLPESEREKSPNEMQWQHRACGGLFLMGNRKTAAVAKAADGEGYILDQRANGAYVVSMNRRHTSDHPDGRSVMSGDIKAIWDKKTNAGVSAKPEGKTAVKLSPDPVYHDLPRGDIELPEGSKKISAAELTELSQVNPETVVLLRMYYIFDREVGYAPAYNSVYDAAFMSQYVKKSIMATGETEYEGEGGGEEEGANPKFELYQLPEGSVDFGSGEAPDILTQLKDNNPDLDIIDLTGTRPDVVTKKPKTSALDTSLFRPLTRTADGEPFTDKETRQYEALKAALSVIDTGDEYVDDLLRSSMDMTADLELHDPDSVLEYVRDEKQSFATIMRGHDATQADIDRWIAVFDDAMRVFWNKYYTGKTAGVKVETTHRSGEGSGAVYDIDVTCSDCAYDQTVRRRIPFSQLQDEYAAVKKSVDAGQYSHNCKGYPREGYPYTMAAQSFKRSVAVAPRHNIQRIGTVRDYDDGIAVLARDTQVHASRSMAFHHEIPAKEGH